MEKVWTYLVKRKKVVFSVFIFIFLCDPPPKNWLGCVFVVNIHFYFLKKVDLNTENEYNFSVFSFSMNMNTVAYS